MVQNPMIASALPLLLKASFITLQASALGAVLGSMGGLLFGIANCDRLRIRGVSSCIAFYVMLIRGTPLFIQLLIIYFALPEALGMDIPSLAAGVITLGLNSSAYLSEIMRGTINALPAGQWEAAEVLGYSRWQTLRHVILPQALRQGLPAIANEFSTLIKESSILMVIGVPELVKTSRDIVARELRPMEIYAMTAVIYLLMTSVVALVTQRLENRS
ncbi:MAG: amino acid ABC transporter permease [Myxococcaceae bacterium]|nr:amino acid ABC transporter permease [Myxococcaceae bacterium]MBH2005881.1 amino acid ABC transporter permease [Myxococcaceae bacterium]